MSMTKTQVNTYELEGGGSIMWRYHWLTLSGELAQHYGLRHLAFLITLKQMNFFESLK
jgi:hypothetical protein